MEVQSLSMLREVGGGWGSDLKECGAISINTCLVVLMRRKPNEKRAGLATSRPSVETRRVKISVT